MATPAKYHLVDDFIDGVRSQGRYIFGLEEIKATFTLTDKAINQVLFRLKKKKRIAQIRRTFYAILSPEYSKQGMVPVTLFIDDMMRLLGKQYYVGLISAAALYGAAHQQPMEYFVVTEKPALRDIKSKKVKINFYVKKEWHENDIVQKKTDAGKINVSSPELTGLDLLYYIESTGLNRTYTILQELATTMKATSLAKIAKQFPQTAAIQRLGYLLDLELHEHKLAEALFKVLKERKCFPIRLAADKSKEGVFNPKWNVIKNTVIEGDL